MPTPEKEVTAGTVFVEISPNLSCLKRTLKNLLTAIEAAEQGVDVTPDFCGKQPPTFGVAVNGKIFSENDIKSISEAIKKGDIIP